jgi:glycosidase
VLVFRIVRGGFLLVCWCLVALSGCSSSPSPSAEAPPTRTCTQRLWFYGGSAVQVVGSWDQWQQANNMLPATDNWTYWEPSLPPGEYGYSFRQAGKNLLDNRNPLTTFRTDTEEEVSLLQVPDCTQPELQITTTHLEDSGALRIHAQFLAGTSGSPLDVATIQITSKHGNFRITESDPQTGKFTIESGQLPRGKVSVQLTASDHLGKQSPSITTSTFIEPVLEDWTTGLLYQVMIDRFRGPGGAPLAPPATLSSRAGGSLDGVTAEIEQGKFEKLGVTALWLSPVYPNPKGPHAGRDGHDQEGYHGYWALDSRAVEPDIGGQQAMERLVQTAHEHGLRLLVDFVPNHVYEKNPRYIEHAKDGWFHTGKEACICGESDCPWGTYLFTCQFASYLPDYRFEQPEVMKITREDAFWWLSTYDLDGLRIDAVPMMPRAVTRRLRQDAQHRVFPEGSWKLLGEVFTGPGASGLDSLRYYLGPDTLDSTFDFPLLWSLRSVIAQEQQGFEELERTLIASESMIEGSGSFLAKTIGNHDVTRFFSESVGDAMLDPWVQQPIQSSSPIAYAKQGLALSVIMTIPGLPLIYYGDEIGLAGANDPDCRRVMPAESELLPEQQALQSRIERLGRLRLCSQTMRQGTRQPLLAQGNFLAYLRKLNDQPPTIVVMSRASQPEIIALPTQGIVPGRYRDVFSGELISFGSETYHAVPMTAYSVRVLVPETDTCGVE